jgi:hypothetical protein
MRLLLVVFILSGGFTALDIAGGAELHVGPGQPFSRPEEALAKARAGDVLVIHRLENGQSYEGVALLVRVPHLTIRAAREDAGGRVKVSGSGFEYSGAGHVPRAIVQFDPDAQDGVLEGFELSDAHNATHNGAGVRINQANGVRILDCDIHGNDMGVMSNGRANSEPSSGADQWIECCTIHQNGAPQDPGYNHNLYLGGTSVTVINCEVYASVTGHNVKSRAHVTRIIGCYIHDAAAREIDLVDEAGNTDLPGSDALLLRNVIVKAKNNAGNHTVIHFGQDGGHDRNGTLYLIHNTIVTPFISPVVDLSARQVRAWLEDNLIWDNGAEQKGQLLIKDRTGSGNTQAVLAGGQGNFFCGGFGPQGSLGESVSGSEPPPFADPTHGNFHLAKQDSRLCGKARPLSEMPLPAGLLNGLENMPDESSIGAFSFKP